MTSNLPSVLKSTKTLLVMGLTLAATVAYALRKRSDMPNVTPYPGQLFTISTNVDAKFKELAVYVAGASATEEKIQYCMNLLMWSCYIESGLQTLIFNCLEDGSYKAYRTKEATYTKKPWAGGVFQCLMKYSAEYIGSNGSMAKGSTAEEKALLLKDFRAWIRADYNTQLDSMLLWLKDWKAAGKINSPLDIRILGFAPARLGKPDSTTVYESPSGSYEHHRHLDVDPKDGKITIGELRGIYIKAYNTEVAKAIKRGGPRQIKVS